MHGNADSRGECCMSSLESAITKNCCGNCDNPSYLKRVFLRTYRAGQSIISKWKVCSDCKDDPDFNGTLDDVTRTTIISEEVYRN